MREPYNIVEYDPTDPARNTYLEGIATPGLDVVIGRGRKLNEGEAVDDIRVFDNPPFQWSRMGSGA